jgi:hypothetical protein
VGNPTAGMNQLTSDTPADAPPPSRGPRLLHGLGWRHSGFAVSRRANARLALVLLLALPCALDVFYSAAIRERFDDLARWRAAAVDFTANPAAPLYDNHPDYLYPPFFLLAVRPLFHLPGPAAGAAWALLKWIGVYFALRITWRLCAPAREDVPPIVALGSMLCTARFFDNDIGHGNINVFMLLFVVTGFALVRRGWPIAGGFVVGTFACIKLLPALVLVWLVYKGAWRVILGAALAAAVFLLLCPAAAIGWERNLELLGQWYEHVVGGFVSAGDVVSIYLNQAPTAVLNRLFRPTTAFLRGGSMTLFVLSPHTLHIIRNVYFALILLALAWVCRPRRRLVPPLALAAELGLVLIATLQFSGYAWKASYVVMLVPYTVLLAHLADARQPPRGRRVIFACLVISFILCSVTSDAITPTGARFAAAYGAILIGGLVAALGVYLVRSAIERVPGAAGVEQFAEETVCPRSAAPPRCLRRSN